MKNGNISAGFVAGLSLLLFCIPLRLSIAFLAAATAHELAHLLLCRLMQVPVSCFSLTLCGAEIQAHFYTRRQEFLCVFAGPACNLLLLFFAPLQKDFALCNLLLAIYNLLPLQTLDGGRLLRLYCSDTVIIAAELTCVLALAVFGVVMCCMYHAGLWSCVFAAIVIAKSQVLEKTLQIPHKRRKIKEKLVEVCK